ncbi:unnamed protein product, partial [Effrenium voratum]
ENKKPNAPPGPSGAELGARPRLRPEELLPELQRERLAQDKAAALDRKARELAGERRANALPFFSEKIQCQGCSLWGAFYDRIPHALRCGFDSVIFL